MANGIEKWVEAQVAICKPDKIVWCDGSEEEAYKLLDIGMNIEKLNGPVFEKLDQDKWPNSYFHRSSPTDVARVEHLTFVCHKDKEVAGPNNNWMEPEEAKKMMHGLTDGCMKGRTMYVLPYMMGHPDSPYSKACIQLTDSAYVAVSMRIMTRMTKKAMDRIGDSDDFVKGLHSVGNLNPDRRFIMHFPDEKFVWSVGSGYGGNALLGKKCFALRIASWMGKKEGWLAEHMVILGVESPEGEVTYIAAALPSACGKTNLAMLESALPGYKIWTLGDDIAWLNVGPDGRLWAINPETGFFGVAPGTSMKTNPNMMRTLKEGTYVPTLFTNTGLDPVNKEPWWEGLDSDRPENLIDWKGNKFDPATGGPAAHANSRFTVSIYQCPVLSKEFDNPKGVPISAILFGGKRSSLIPLVMESFNWDHGVFMGARMGSETTAANMSAQGVIRRDPMAMLPFTGYNMGEYFGHWMEVGKKLTNPPAIYSINWFRKDENGKFLWPGFGDNIRVLKWIIERIKGKVGAIKTPAGLVPDVKDFDLSGTEVTAEEFAKITAVDKKEWQAETADIKEYLEQFGKHTPDGMWKQYEDMAQAMK